VCSSDLTAGGDTLKAKTDGQAYGTGVAMTANNSVLATALANRLDWRLVESEDYRKYIANLRAIGCPEETIRDIVIADLRKLFESRAKAIKAAARKYEYWKREGAFYDEETRRKLQELAKERQAVCKELLGVDVPVDLSGVSLQDRIEREMAFLPTDKLKRFNEMYSEYDRRREEAAKKGDREELKRLRAEREAEMSRLFTPEERFEADLRLSPTALDMRAHLGGFEATEEEFRGLFTLRKRYDDEFGPGGTAWGASDYAERSEAALKGLNGEIRGLLGDERYREYAFEKEWSNAGLQGMAKQFNISKDMWMQVFDAKTAAQEQADRLRLNSSLGAGQRQAALDAIRAETEKVVGGVIGKDLLPGYIKLDPWIQKLNASPSSSGTP
jgi:hypothetical protein